MNHPGSSELREAGSRDEAARADQDHARAQAAALAARYPDHTITVEDGIPGRATRFVAKASTAGARPYLIVTRSLDELQHEITSPPAPAAPSPLPRRVPGASWAPSATA